MPEIRITAGTLRGRKVVVPGDDVRPTSGRARQAYFNMVADRVGGARFLDLFAGSGIFSFEALSRGAAEAHAIEQSPRAAEAIARAAANLDAAVRVIRGDVFVALPRLVDHRFDLVYADPPYATPRYVELLELLDGTPALAPGAVVGIEHRRGRLPFDIASPRSLTFRKTAVYSDVAFSLFIRG
jgi:16S rRNA (guanine966-N2)-methyltransferase